MTVYLKVGYGYREITQEHIDRVAKRIERRRSRDCQTWVRYGMEEAVVSIALANEKMRALETSKQGGK
jgi:hypothetical protein